MATKKEITKYMDLPWSYSIEPEEGYYVIRVLEMPFVCSDGKDPLDAIKNIKEALHLSIEVMLDKNMVIPVPIDKSKYRGNIAYRTSENKHYCIARLAKRRHLSISKTIDLLVEEGLKSLEHSLV